MKSIRTFTDGNNEISFEEDWESLPELQRDIYIRAANNYLVSKNIIGFASAEEFINKVKAHHLVGSERPHRHTNLKEFVEMSGGTVIKTHPVVAHCFVCDGKEEA